MTEQEYRKHPALNFSKLSEFDNSPKLYMWKKTHPDDMDGDKSYFHIGAGLDALITGSENEFKTSFSIGTIPAPSDTLRTLCDVYIHNIVKGIPESVAFDDAYSKSGYKTSKKTVKSNFECDIPQTYVKEKLEAYPKRYLSKDEGELVMKMYRLMQKNTEVEKYFGKKQPKHIQQYYQHAIIFNVKGKETKALLDLLWIDHKNKVVQPIDLKTTSKNIEDFDKSFIQYRYYIQAAFYSEATAQWMQRMTMLKDTGGHDYSDYTLLPFKFIVCDKSGYTIPMIFDCTKNDLEKGKTGGYLKSGKYVRGYVKLIEDLAWHEQHKVWDAPREMIESSFTRTLDVFK